MVWTVAACRHTGSSHAFAFPREQCLLAIRAPLVTTHRAIGPTAVRSRKAGAQGRDVCLTRIAERHGAHATFGCANEQLPERRIDDRVLDTHARAAPSIGSGRHAE